MPDPAINAEEMRVAGGITAAIGGKCACPGFSMKGLRVKVNYTHVNKDERYWLGIEEDSQRYFLAIPVRNQLVGYMEWYVVDRARYDQFIEEPVMAAAFADSCRRREQDEILLLKPGRDRGVPD
jgi:hypothetical protein